ncbi:uncharacterized protein LOC117642368 [Thrips palmi]|uniref:Uncharacterized protein LOC117642368 n=1 Tax=Thrips palmi TaxID=161013 RepID=A0A6P8ZK22_THRPL|nr:uncharacterized protein LOC117642368 [Thrips palmi]
MGGPGLHRLAKLAAVAVLAAGAVLWGVAPASAEIFDEPCYELGKQWVYEAKDMLLCDRSGRRININKFCKARLSAASGRLIIDSSKDDEAVETKKQVGHFPELCLPGQRSYAMQAPFLCTCVMHKGRHRWECVAPEGGAGRGLGGESPSSNRVRRHASPASPASAGPGDRGDAEEHSSTPGHGRSAGKPGSAAPAMASSASTTSSAEAHDDAHVAHDAGAHNGSAVMGRQAAPFRPNIVIDFCDEFGYVHTVSSTMRDCSCDKDVIATKVLSFRDNDLYHSGGLFATYECLPGTYNVRCEVCYPETHNCQPTACP